MPVGCCCGSGRAKGTKEKGAGCCAGKEQQGEHGVSVETEGQKGKLSRVLLGLFLILVLVSGYLAFALR